MSILSYLREDNERVRPWTRFFARTVDIVLVTDVLRVFHLLPSSFWASLVILNLCYIFSEAVLLSKVGTTLGKSLLRITVADSEGNRLSFSTAVKRTFLVYFKGCALKIPVLEVITLIIAYRNLKTYQITSWDEDCHTVVTHQNSSLGKWLIAVFISVILPLALVAGIIFGLQQSMDAVKKNIPTQFQTAAQSQTPQEKQETPPETPAPSTPNNASSDNPTSETASPPSENNSSSSEQAPKNEQPSSTQDAPTNERPSWMHEVPNTEPRPKTPKTPDSDQSSLSED